MTGFLLSRRGRCTGYIFGQLVVVIIVTGSEKEVIRAALCAKMASCKEKAAIFADFLKANRTFKHPAIIFRNRAFRTMECNRHNRPIISGKCKVQSGKVESKALTFHFSLSTFTL